MMKTRVLDSPHAEVRAEGEPRSTHGAWGHPPSFALLAPQDEVAYLGTARETKLLAEPLAGVAEDGAFEGYGSLFNVADLGKDTVLPGAFAESLSRRGVSGVRMLFQHDPAEPVGVWLELREDARGLYARGRLIPEVARGRELLALLRAGTSDGLSIGFRTVKGRLDPKTRIRRLDVIDLWEISIVTFPLLPGARVHSVKESISTPRSREWTRRLAPADAATSRFKPERLFRRQARFRFGRGEAGMTWRDLILSERALRQGGHHRRGP